jgi:hypothetical protein
MAAGVVWYLQGKSIAAGVYMRANAYYNLIGGNQMAKQNTMRNKR